VHRFEEFIKARAYFKNVTPKTVDWYRDSFGAFKRFHSSEDCSKQSLAAFVVALPGQRRLTDLLQHVLSRH
jgi:hypothetical protein